VYKKELVCMKDKIEKSKVWGWEIENNYLLYIFIILLGENLGTLVLMRGR
jgi:hypothetical protein